MSREVSGEEEGVTLIQAIEAGRIPEPGELTFGRWQAWRKGPGMRPTLRRDGRGLTTQEEVDLWRSVMEHFYGEGRLEALDEGEGSEEGRDLEALPSPSVAPSQESEGRPRGNGSPRPSSVGTGGASVVSLQGKLRALYDPTTEDFGAYLLRMGRTINALSMIEGAVPPGTLERLTRKAELVIELHAEHGCLDKARAVRFLRDKFMAYAQDDSVGEEEKDLSIRAIGELIEQLGGKPSSSPSKLFSTPSDDRGPEVKGSRGPAVAASAAGRGPDGLEDPSLRSKLAAMEIELEGLKREKAMSEAGSASPDGLAAALEEQTRVLKEALAGRGKESTVTAVKTDLHWPTLGDDRSDFRDVSHFYEEFEDICALANSCRGMNQREMLLALRARCRGSRLKTYTNVYRAAWNSGEVLEDPGAVYARIKSKHLMFSESREEREIRVDAEHVALMKGKLTGGQFEPLFEASVAELESVGLGKTPRELFLSYLRKIGTVLQKEVRADRRLWGTEDRLRGPQTWEEAHRVVLEFEQREATNRATANAVYAVGHETDKPAKKKKEDKPSKDSKGTGSNVGVVAGDPRSEKICWDFRDHGTCRKGRDCPFSHDKELRKRELAKKGGGKGSQGGGSAATQSALPAKGTGKGKKGGKGKGDQKSKGSQNKKDKPCPFFAKKGACKKGANCDMSHALVASSSPAGQPAQMPAGWAAPSGAAMANPFAAFMVITGKPGSNDISKGPAGSDSVLASDPRPDRSSQEKGFLTELDQLPSDWWQVVENERGGYQYKTVTKIIDTLVETMLDGCAGSNHITEELVVSILNRAAKLGISPEDSRFPIVRFEKWVYPEFVHGIASGSPVPLKGSVVLRIRLQEGAEVKSCVDGHEIFVRCKIAARGTSDWHGLILGGRALDCEARRGLGFRPGPTAHIFDTLGVQVPRCEDFLAERKDRAYAFRSVLSAVDSGLEGAAEPETGPRALVVFQGEEDVELQPGEGALVPVAVIGDWVSEVSTCETILPVEGKVEAVPGIWDTGLREGLVLVTPRQEPVCLEKGDPVAELRRGLVSAGACSCGSLETVMESPVDASRTRACAECGQRQVSFNSLTCQVCGESGNFEARPLQGCRGCDRQGRGSSKKTSKVGRGYGMVAMVGVLALSAFMPSTYAFADRGSGLRFRDQTAGKRIDSWMTFPKGWVKTHEQPRKELFCPEGDGSLPASLDRLDDRRVTWVKFLDGETLVWEDNWRTPQDPSFQNRLWVGETRFFERGYASGSASSWTSTVTEPVYHIVEVPGGIDKMAEETPTDFYYDRLRDSLAKRYSKADPFLLDHLVSLEAFLDKSIIFGFSFGVSKAELCKDGGKLLGHVIGRSGSSPDPERAKAVREFAPLKEKLHIQQFLGCANWLRTYLPAEFGHCAKVLTGYQKPGAEFPPEGLGAGKSEGCKAVRAIKQMLEKTIGISVFDEATAISGECPLEQVADASGYAVGGTVLQMARDLSHMKVLLTHSKSLTPAQQAWPPLIQEAFAQLEVKRATRKSFGSIKTICWTDHANLTKAQHMDVGADVKLVRWVAEILSDGSEIRSLSGRSAKLGDGFSRNPAERDELIQGRTKDLEGLAGQLKGFNLEEYLSGGTEEPDIPVAWAIGNDVLPSGARSVSGERAGMFGHSAALASAERVKVLFVTDYGQHSDNSED